MCHISFTFSDPPFAPKNLRVTSYDIDHIVICWDAPDHDGGSPIERYVIDKRDALRATWGPAGSSTADTLTFRADGLLEGDSYFLRVAAENKVGLGEFIETIDAQMAKLPFGKKYHHLSVRNSTTFSNKSLILQIVTCLLHVTNFSHIEHT